MRGTFAFYLFKEHLDDLDPSLVDAYGQIMKNTFGIYDDENAIAMMLSMLAQGQKTGGGSSKVIIKEVKSNITIKATAICFPMLVHELIKGLYELISLQGFKGSKEERQAVVDKVDLLKNEPSDLRYGKFIYDALNNIFAKSEYNDPRIREFFFTDVYQLDDDEFISFIENAINEELTSAQQKWAKDTLRDISIDLKADDFDATGLGEIRVNKPVVKYHLSSEFKPWLNRDYEDVIYNFDEDTADALFMFKAATQDDKTISKHDIIQLFNKKELMGDPDDYLSFLELMDVVQNKPTTNEIKVKQNKVEIAAPVTENKSFLESFYKEVKILADDFKTSLINEYSEKTIATTIERWKKDNPKVDDNIAKQIIQRFDQVKSGLPQKLNIIVLPDELKKGQNYLNIDKYSYDDMINLIKSLPENPDKVKKDAIKKFIEKEQINRQSAQSYVARFMANKDKLKLAAQEGLEDEGFTKEEILKFIPKNLQQRDAFLDPRNWSWRSFEQMLDAIFPSQKTAVEGEENLVSTDANKIYDKDGIEIYKGDDVHKCISYNPVSDKTKRKKYGWCVTQVGNTNYDYYRFGDKAPTFYFVFDRSKNSSPEHAPFNDQWHAFVIQVTADDKEYIVTGADNRGDIPTKDKGWEGVSNIVPADTWAKIKGLKDYFKPITLSPVERGRKFASGKNLNLNEFKELSQDEKIQYILGKASKNQLTPEILKILPEYKISYEGRSTTLMNIAIDGGQDIPYNILSKYEPLAKRYAIFRSRHDVLGQKAIPLPFVKYLDEPAKEKYLKTFDENLTFEYIDKFFGPTSAEKYVNEQAKKLDYLPKEAFKYIKDPNLKQLYEVYSKLFDSWEFSSNTNIDDETLNNLSIMPDQEISPVPINQEQWSKLSPAERGLIIKLAEKYNKNTNYTTLLYALPYIIEDKGKKYVLLPKSTTDFDYDSWVLMDEQGKVVKNNISGDMTLDGQPLSLGYPDEDSSYNRIYNIKDLKND